MGVNILSNALLRGLNGSGQIRTWTKPFDYVSIKKSSESHVTNHVFPVFLCHLKILNLHFVTSSANPRFYILCSGVHRGHHTGNAGSWNACIFRNGPHSRSGGNYLDPLIMFNFNPSICAINSSLPMRRIWPKQQNSPSSGATMMEQTT